MSSVKSPRAKKRLAYERDHVAPAEYPHAFRKQWPRKKARAGRAYRRKVRQLLRAAGADAPVAAVRREEMRKWGTVPLRESVRLKQEKRRTMVGAHKARRARTRES